MRKSLRGPLRRQVKLEVGLGGCWECAMLCVLEEVDDVWSEFDTVVDVDVDK